MNFASRAAAVWALTFVGPDSTRRGARNHLHGSRLSHAVGLPFKKRPQVHSKLNPRSFGDAPIMTFVLCLPRPEGFLGKLGGWGQEDGVGGSLGVAFV